MGQPPPMATSMGSLELHRVTAGVGWAVHALVFEYKDGTRTGRVVANSGREMDLTDESIAARYAHSSWYHVDSGDYIVQIRGRGLRGEGTSYLCHGITLLFASGREVSFRSSHMPWEGEREFVYGVPQPGLLRNVRFQGGTCVGADAIKTSVHVGITRNFAKLLPERLRRQLLFVLMVANRLDDERAGRNLGVLGTDVWWKVLGMLRGFDLEPN